MTLMLPPPKLFIAGSWREAADGRTIDVINPSDGEAIARIARGLARDVDDAVAAARAAFPAWRDAGFDLLPQAYYNQFPKVYRPDQTVAHALRAKWPLDRVHPVIGVYRKYPASRYVPLLRAAGPTGYSVFLADQATAADYAALSELNQR